MAQCTDKFGHAVEVGSQVRLVELPGLFLESLATDELEEINSMIGQVFEVCDIDDKGCAWIEKAWHYPEVGHCVEHSLGLASHEMELIEAGSR